MLIVLGLTGAGKTSVLNEFKKTAKKIKGMKIINHGNIIFDIGMKKGVIKSRDEICNIPGLPVITHLKLQEEAMKKIKDGKRVILDTHAMMKRQPFGFIPGLRPDLIKKIKVDGIVYIDAPSSEIIARRKRDKTRTRPIPKQEELDERRFLAKILICHYAAITTAPFYFVENREGKIKDAVKELIKITKDIGW